LFHQPTFLNLQPGAGCQDQLRTQTVTLDGEHFCGLDVCVNKRWGVQSLKVQMKRITLGVRPPVAFSNGPRGIIACVPQCSAYATVLSKPHCVLVDMFVSQAGQMDRCKVCCMAGAQEASLQLVIYLPVSPKCLEHRMLCVRTSLLPH